MNSLPFIVDEIADALLIKKMSPNVTHWAYVVFITHDDNVFSFCILDINGERLKWVWECLMIAIYPRKQVLYDIETTLKGINDDDKM